MSDVREVNAIHEQAESMLTLDGNTDENGIPRRYSAEWHWPGCLPETDVILWDTPREAWNDLIDRLSESDLMWEPMDPDDEDGPQQMTGFAATLQFLAEWNRPGTISDNEGMIYCVEDTWVMTCGECKRAFPDLYPSGRCPYEYEHKEV